jgi:CDP-6-deoxy-D-xylo-4-hexulose-3-dehydrase
LLFSGNILKQPVFVYNHFPLRIKDSGVLYSDELIEEHYKMLPNTEFVMNNTFWIGVYPGIDEDSLNYMVEVFDNFISENAGLCH